MVGCAALGPTPFTLWAIMNASVVSGAGAWFVLLEFELAPLTRGLLVAK